jgi:hypothetical protein
MKCNTAAAIEKPIPKHNPKQKSLTAFCMMLSLIVWRRLDSDCFNNPLSGMNRNLRGYLLLHKRRKGCDLSFEMSDLYRVSKPVPLAFGVLVMAVLNGLFDRFEPLNQKPCKFLPVVRCLLCRVVPID